jgi:hypothetical protein
LREPVDSCGSSSPSSIIPSRNERREQRYKKSRERDSAIGRG